MISVSKRLQAIVDWIDGTILADIGCDHAYVAIEAIRQKKVLKAYACDIAQGPLNNAKKTIEELGLQDKIECVLMDGISGLSSEVDFVVIADKKRITKESFQRFLDGQDRYHLDARIEYSEVAAEENMALADFRRKKLFKSGVRRGNGNKNYLTRAEAAMLAKVSKPTIDYWANKGHYTIVKIGELVRIPRAEFEDWLNYRENMEEK